MPKTAHEVLTILDTFFMEADTKETKTLWSILSALRGPDQEDDAHYKSLSTAYIRSLAFPQCHRSIDNSPEEMRIPLCQYIEFAESTLFPNELLSHLYKIMISRDDFTPHSNHFEMHCRFATRALLNMNALPSNV